MIEKRISKGLKVALFELSACLQESQHHRNGIPHGYLLVLDEGRQLERKNRQTFRDKRDGQGRRRSL